MRTFYKYLQRYSIIWNKLGWAYAIRVFYEWHIVPFWFACGLIWVTILIIFHIKGIGF